MPGAARTRVKAHLRGPRFHALRSYPTTPSSSWPPARLSSRAVAAWSRRSSRAGSANGSHQAVSLDSDPRHSKHSETCLPAPIGRSPVLGASLPLAPALQCARRRLRSSWILGSIRIDKRSATSRASPTTATRPTPVPSPWFSQCVTVPSSGASRQICSGSSPLTCRTPPYAIECSSCQARRTRPQSSSASQGMSSTPCRSLFASHRRPASPAKVPYVLLSRAEAIRTRLPQWLRRSSVRLEHPRPTISSTAYKTPPSPGTFSRGQPRSLAALANKALLRTIATVALRAPSGACRRTPIR